MWHNPFVLEEEGGGNKVFHKQINKKTKLHEAMYWRQLQQLVQGVQEKKKVPIPLFKIPLQAMFAYLESSSTMLNGAYFQVRVHSGGRVQIIISCLTIEYVRMRSTIVFSYRTELAKTESTRKQGEALRHCWPAGPCSHFHFSLLSTFSHMHTSVQSRSIL